ncbi:hypothetical protein ABMA28_005514 [Loxostege sticticalis]|uniref:THAP-type domain-containing protein n=1 Tax=Loxostege sticticalis TaxID=481309 RepID=A0ABD0SLX6_LOXSC
MPSCVVKWCKNNTTSQKKCQGTTLHRFPTGNKPWKDDWTRIIRNCRGQEDWSASKSSVVCSIHFDQNDLYTTSKGRRRLVTYATRIKLFMPISQPLRQTGRPIRRPVWRRTRRIGIGIRVTGKTMGDKKPAAISSCASFTEESRVALRLALDSFSSSVKVCLPNKKVCLCPAVVVYRLI